LLQLLCAASILLGGGTVVVVATAKDAPPAFASDDFNRPSLAPVQWTVIDPVGDSTVASEGTWTSDAWLRLSLLAGPEHNPWDENNGVRVLQPTADRDFNAEIGFASEPGVNQSQGFLVEQDAKNWLRFAFYHDGTQLRVQATSTVGGETRATLDHSVEAGGPLRLQVQRDGDDWTVRTSADASEDGWVTIGAISRAMEVTASGPDAGNTGTPSPPFTALVDYVVETDHWSMSEDTERSVSAYQLTVAATGDGTVSRSPDRASYPRGRAVTLTAEPKAGWAFVEWTGDLRSTNNPLTIAMDGERSLVARFVPDVSPPAVSMITVTPSATSAVVRWTTDEPATSTVLVGASSGYELGSFGTPYLTRDHIVTIPGLAPGGTYHYSVRPTDRVQLAAESPDASFTTPLVGGPAIDVWQGLDHVVGAHGQPQTWVNIDGNVADPNGVTSLSYSLNGAAPRPLTVGPDGRRLQASGDFNAEVAYDALVPGPNQVRLIAIDGTGDRSFVTVNLERLVGAPALPYATNWADAGRIGDQAQVVDGKWSLDNGSIRIVELGYDRVVTIGDVGWHDYEITVPVTVHRLGSDANTHTSGPPVVGLGLHWNGHTVLRGEQPAQHWYPTGALGWYRWYRGDPKFELRGNDDTPIVRHGAKQIQLGQPHMLKARTETVAGGVRYSWKSWAQGQAEPTGWDLTVFEDAGPASGSIALIAHHVEAQFGDLTVTPIGG
jgi:hypothetical protein